MTRGYGPGGAPLAGLAEVVAALQAVAGLTAGSAALSRLATLAGRLGIDFPAGLRPLTRPAELPDAWASVLDHRGAADGPDRVAAVAAVLPEVDGARFALAGLDSVAGSATLRVVAWGWQPSSAGPTSVVSASPGGRGTTGAAGIWPGSMARTMEAARWTCSSSSGRRWIRTPGRWRSSCAARRARPR